VVCIEFEVFPKMKKSITFLMLFSVLAIPIVNGNINENKKPNIIFILSDDLNWGDLGCYGQQKIKTPNIDRIAREGILFTNAYAGSAVCAPSRATLMEGKHTGHARIRDNMYSEYRESLQKEDITVARLLQKAGYKTGLFGKWGLSLVNQPGIPNNMGFDEFFGYLNQRHAHCYYPEFLYKNRRKIYYPVNGEFNKIENYRSNCVYDKEGRALPLGIKNPSMAKYSLDEYCKYSLEFVKRNKDNPFFLFLAYTIPHGATIVPDLGEYKNKKWPVRAKEYAAMLTRMDLEIGKLLRLLKKLDLDNNTIIFFASDNGSYSNDHPMVSFFNSASPTYGNKGNPYHGAFHVPAMARWPKHIKSNRVSNHIWAFWDFLPTVAEIVGDEPPSNIDGISFLPTLIGKGEQKTHKYLYWEYKQYQLVRYGDYYAYKPNQKSIQLFNLKKDPQQIKDLSKQFPGVIEEIKSFMNESHTQSDFVPSPGENQQEFQLRINRLGIPERPKNAGLF
jgi:arylsulfatase A-like enzyme